MTLEEVIFLDLAFMLFVFSMTAISLIVLSKLLGSK